MKISPGDVGEEGRDFEDVLRGGGEMDIRETIFDFDFDLVNLLIERCEDNKFIFTTSDSLLSPFSSFACSVGGVGNGMRARIALRSACRARCVFSIS